MPWVDFGARASASGLAGGFATNFGAGRGGLAAIDASTGKVAWQQKLPSMDFGAATVANDVVFTSAYAGQDLRIRYTHRQDALDGQAPAGINSFPAVDGDTLLVGAGAAGFAKNPRCSYRLFAVGVDAGVGRREQLTTQLRFWGRRQRSSGSRWERARSRCPVRSSASRSTNSQPKPGQVTFVFKNVGHVLHDFSINGKQTPLVQPGQTAKLVVDFTKPGKYPYLCTVPGHAAAGMKGTFTVQ